jgi:hypothetical protein
VIVHLATEAGRRTLAHVSDRSKPLGSAIEVVQYRQIPERSSWPRGLYLFTDMERATEEETRLAVRLHGALQGHEGAVRTLNHPTDHLKRFDLLRTLYEAGVNDFNVYRASEVGEEIRYPAFLRYTDRHIGPLTPLLHTRAELDAALSGLVDAGHPIDRLLAVEYLDTSDAEGVFAKYGAFRFGPHVVAGHMFASAGWNAKRESDRRDLVGSREVEWLQSFAERDQVLAAFQVARLEYGRMDYAIKEGRVQVWEINDNPSMGTTFFKRRLFSRTRARRIMRPRRRAAFQDLLAGLDLSGAPLAFQIGLD